MYNEDSSNGNSTFPSLPFPPSTRTHAQTGPNEEEEKRPISPYSIK